MSNWEFTGRIEENDGKFVIVIPEFTPNFSKSPSCISKSLARFLGTFKK